MVASTGIDQGVLDSVVSERTPGWVDVVTVITDSGGTIAVWIASAVIVTTFLLRGDRGSAWFVAGVMLSGWALSSGLKLLFARERPPIPLRLVEISSYSFPSGHAMMTSMFVCVVGVLLARMALPVTVRASAYVCLGLYTLAVGSSRIYLAAHWTTDVVAGWVLGALWVAVCVAALRQTRPCWAPRSPRRAERRWARNRA
ncbi:phosphatase PAP2 family protein [Rhodococcus sp. NPDC058521]|uniref:phosphatase PAP2 family protein n=1 Tax=Rhodococcus sp. NPDC058521 TaxID=3346536 RepID=UPI0036512BA4